MPNTLHCKHCTRFPTHGYATWAAIIGGALLLEAEGLRRRRYEHTLSHTTRYVFKTHTPVGKAAFVTGWSLLTYWFLPHVLNGANKVSQVITEIVEEITDAEPVA